jgi:hypothetical protein
MHGRTARSRRRGTLALRDRFCRIIRRRNRRKTALRVSCRIGECNRRRGGARRAGPPSIHDFSSRCGATAASGCCRARSRMPTELSSTQRQSYLVTLPPNGKARFRSNAVNRQPPRIVMRARDSDPKRPAAEQPVILACDKSKMKQATRLTIIPISVMRQGSRKYYVSWFG